MVLSILGKIKDLNSAPKWNCGVMVGEGLPSHWNLQGRMRPSQIWGMPVHTCNPEKLQHSLGHTASLKSGLVTQQKHIFKKWVQPKEDNFIFHVEALGDYGP